MEGETKRTAISETLRREIISGKYDATKKLLSEHQLMRRFSAPREVRVATERVVRERGK